MSTRILALLGMLAGIAGIGIGYWIRHILGQKRANSVELTIKAQLEDARAKARETI